MDVGLEFLQERYDLSIEKIRQIVAEGCSDLVSDGEENIGTDSGSSAVTAYFVNVAGFICLVDEFCRAVQQNGLLNISSEHLKEWKRRLYQDILQENYGSSFADPAYAAEKLGEDYGRLLSALYAEVRGMIELVTEAGSLEELVIRMELFVEVYSAYAYEWQENQTRPSYESLRQILYWYVSDYTDITYERERQRLPESFFLWGGGLNMQGCALESPNPQYDYDHREDVALVWDKALMQRKLEVMRTVAEKHKEDDLTPVDKPQAIRFSAEQQRLMKEYLAQAAAIGGSPMGEEYQN